jgi:trigger factor
MKNSSYTLPKTLLASLADDLYEQEWRRLAQSRVPASEIEKREEELRANARERAEYDIKRMITLRRIAEEEGITATDEDFEREVVSLSQQTGLDAELVSQYMQEGEQVSRTEARIVRSKALDFILDHANITDKELTREELEQEEAEAAPDSPATE